MKTRRKLALQVQAKSPFKLNDLDEKGSILLLTLFLLLFLATILMGYWSLIRHKTKMNLAQQQRIRAHLAAQAGIADALYEVKRGEELVIENSQISEQWHADGSLVFKSSILEPKLSMFEYPVTISILVSGNMASETVTITSIGETHYGSNAQQSYREQLTAIVVRSLFGKLHVLEVRKE